MPVSCVMSIWCERLAEPLSALVGFALGKKASVWKAESRGSFPLGGQVGRAGAGQEGGSREPSPLLA